MHRKVVKTMLQSCFQKIFSHLFKLYQYVYIRNDVKTSESYTQVLGVLRMEGAGSARLWHRPPSRKQVTLLAGNCQPVPSYQVAWSGFLSVQDHYCSKQAVDLGITSDMGQHFHLRKSFLLFPKVFRHSPLLTDWDGDTGNIVKLPAWVILLWCESVPSLVSQPVCGAPPWGGENNELPPASSHLRSSLLLLLQVLFRGQISFCYWFEDTRECAASCPPYTCYQCGH